VTTLYIRACLCLYIIMLWFVSCGWFCPSLFVEWVLWLVCTRRHDGKFCTKLRALLDLTLVSLSVCVLLYNRCYGRNSLVEIVWLGGIVVGRRISDREVASSIPGCSAARCNSGQVVHTHVPLFIKQYKLIPASAGGKVHHRSGVGHAGSHLADLAVGSQPAPLQHCSYLWLPLYSGLEVTYITYAAI